MLDVRPKAILKNFIINHGFPRRIGKARKEMDFGINKAPSKSTLTRVMNMVNGEEVAGITINIFRKLALALHKLLVSYETAVWGT